ncbi:MAG: hypothetical protein ACK4GN_02640 [Runella sp.]
MQYDEADFVAYALNEMGIKVRSRNGKYFELEQGFQIEVEGRDLYRLSHEGWVISPFDDIGKLCNFLKVNLQNA